ncbi:hypothetical protein [Eleftheria terrae]|uniref:hypothetical protein n=1 Tax=Eleftheria terrae TaxID=1597781 RepID=UPI00263A78E9|nr:hypothetical protein [Eleftheria terrae]WKB53114.1 hypothetical protein N7L95_01530 [Eleftheria terrae]
MGEAKRKGQQLKVIEDSLRRRVAAGDFGGAGRTEHYCLVLDKSPRGRELLLALKRMPEFAGLQPVFEAEPYRLWEASALFEYLVLCGGSGTPHQRTLLAADTARLVGEVLPRALRQVRAGGVAAGLVLGVADEVAKGLEGAAAQQA